MLSRFSHKYARPMSIVSGACLEPRQGQGVPELSPVLPPLQEWSRREPTVQDGIPVRWAGKRRRYV